MARLVCIFGLLLASRAHTQQPSEGAELRWSPHRRVGLAEYAVTLGSPVLLRMANYALTEPGAARLGGGVLFDDAVRDTLRLRSRDRRDAADLFSDVSWLSSMAYPYVDALLVAWLLRDSPDVAWQMIVISTQAFSITSFVTELSIHHAARERPGQQECAVDPNYAPTCSSNASFHSFPSGHTAGAFVGAGLACAHHLNLPLYDGGAADVVACGLALTWASANALARIASDRHWVSDVIVGAGIGLSLGWLMPELIYFADPETGDLSAGRPLILPFGGPDGSVGLFATGTL